MVEDDGAFAGSRKGCVKVGLFANKNHTRHPPWFVAHETQGHTISGHIPAELVGIGDPDGTPAPVINGSRKGYVKVGLFAKRWHTRFK